MKTTQDQLKRWREATLQAWAAEATAPEKRRAELTLGGTPGLVARLGRSERVSFALRCGFRGAQVTVTLPARTLVEAYDEASEARYKADHGEDPRKDKSSPAGLTTFEDVATAYLADIAKVQRPTSVETTTRHIKKWVEAFGTRDPNTVTRGQVRAELNKLEATPVEARHRQIALSALYTWLSKERQEPYGITVHPVKGMDKTKANERDRTYTDDELRAIWAALGDPKFGEVTRHIKLILHTGTRDFETRAMRWADVDLGRGRWEVPRSVSKSHRPHAVALSSGALDVLRDCPRFGEWVFPDGHGGHVDRSQWTLGAVGKAAGVGELRLHDVRRTITNRVRQKWDDGRIHAMLGHTDHNLTRIYGGSPGWAAVVEAAQWWSDELHARILKDAPAAQPEQA